MELTNRKLDTERANTIGGTQRLYKSGDWGLSLINSPMAHSYPFAWEGAVMYKGELCYTTELTNDVEVFQTDEEANVWINRALDYFDANPEAPGQQTA